MKIELGNTFDAIWKNVADDEYAHPKALAFATYELTRAEAEKAVSARTCESCKHWINGGQEECYPNERRCGHNIVEWYHFTHKDAIMPCWHAPEAFKVPCKCCKAKEAVGVLWVVGEQKPLFCKGPFLVAVKLDYCAACGKTHLAEAVAAWEAKQVKHPCPCCGKESTWFVQVAHGNEANAKRQGHRFSAERCSDMYTYQQENNKFNDSHLGCEKYATDNAARLNAEWREKNGLCECGKPVTGHKRNTDNGRAFFGRRARGHEKSATWYKGDCCDTCGMAWLKEGRTE